MVQPGARVLAQHAEYQRGDFVLTTDPGRFDRTAIHAFLTRSYWAEGIPREVVERAIEGSLSFGLFEGERQIGFARAVTDGATFAYLADVYVLESHRGRGLGRWLVECVMAHPDLQGLRRFMLVTRDAHEIYRPFGFEELRAPERHMERVLANPYGRTPS
jgi:GNAT superfamily N-acetyltransferase